jgi:hypothetical protein
MTENLFNGIRPLPAVHDLFEPMRASGSYGNLGGRFFRALCHEFFSRIDPEATLEPLLEWPNRIQEQSACGLRTMYPKTIVHQCAYAIGDPPCGWPNIPIGIS